MHESRPIIGARGSARVAGGDFVHSRAFEWLSRAGFVARALIYAIIGILALKLALGAGGKLTNQQGALHTVAHQPFGKVLLTLVAIGLGGYALWRFVRAAIGHGPEGSDSRLRSPRGIRERRRLCIDVRRRGRDPCRLRRRRQLPHSRQGGGRDPGLARRHVDRRHRRRRGDRHRRPTRGTAASRENSSTIRRSRR